MIARLREGWHAAWFAQSGPANLRACRAILGAQALYILLSRPDIPRLASWPEAFFPAAERLTFLRFGILRGGQGLEWSLWALLHIALVLVVAGRVPRAACGVSGLLLYHFAPFEEIIVGANHTFFGGLTTPTVGLFVLAFASPPRAADATPSPEFRWPVTLVRLLFSFSYVFALFAKLSMSGPLWFTGETIRGFLLYAQATTQPLLALPIANRTWLCGMLAAATLGLELFFLLAVFSKHARRVLVPAAFVFHTGVALSMDILFPSEPLLLLFVNWEWLGARLRGLGPSRARTSRPEPAARA